MNICITYYNIGDHIATCSYYNNITFKFAIRTSTFFIIEKLH